MKNWAIGWACNLQELFILFPYEKYKTLTTKWTQKIQRLKVIKDVFKYCVYLVVKDIVENNVTFHLPNYTTNGAEIHMEAISGEDFIKVRKAGKFKEIDFLESCFTGFQMYLYIHGKRDNFLYAKKYPIYISNKLKNLLNQLTNNGKQYG